MWTNCVASWKGVGTQFLEAQDELQINTVTQQVTQQNLEKPKQTCHHCKRPGHYRNQCRQLKGKTDQARNYMNSADNNNNINSGQTNSNSNNKSSNNTNANNTITRKTEELDLSTHPLRPLVKLTLPQKNVSWERTHLIDRLPGTDDRKDRTKPNREMPKATQIRLFKLQPKL